MTDREIVTEYRHNVIAAHTIHQSIVWNQRHGLPIMNLPDQLRELRERILRFEDVLTGISESRTRTIIRCRYALGWNIMETADFMDMSGYTISQIAQAALARLELITTENAPSSDSGDAWTLAGSDQANISPQNNVC